MKLSAAGVFGASYTGWMNVLAGHAAATGATSQGKAKAAILLWLAGGPSHKETWDLKPDSKSPGEFKPIATSAPGVKISEHLSKLAKLMNYGAIIRGMSTGEGAHPRASYNMHTGYREGQGGLVYPSIGAIVSHEMGKKDFPLPNYVSIGGRSFGSGYLGPKNQPLIVNDPNRGVEDLKPVVASGQLDKRFGLLEEMEKAFYGNYQTDNINDHKTTYARAVSMMRSKEAKAFDLSQESSSTKSAYGSSQFGQGCLMARRLVEVGIPFVEVSLGGWDTHQDNFNRLKNTLLPPLDTGASALIADLKTRGLLDSTLVIVMGEFGRTPNINARAAAATTIRAAGRSPCSAAASRAAWSTAPPTRKAATVVEGKTSTIDFMATVCKLMGIDFTKEIETATKRPVRIVDKGAKAVDAIIVVVKYIRGTLAFETKKARGNPLAFCVGFRIQWIIVSSVEPLIGATPMGIASSS